MKPKGIVTGQKVTRQRVEMAKDLRRNMTAAEQRLWEQLRANRLDGWHFRRQQIIDGFIVDFYCHRAGLVVEVDGSVHEGQEAADAQREAVLRGHRLGILRFSNGQVMNQMPLVRREIRTFLGKLERTSE